MFMKNAQIKYTVIIFNHNLIHQWESDRKKRSRSLEICKNLKKETKDPGNYIMSLPGCANITYINYSHSVRLIIIPIPIPISQVFVQRSDRQHYTHLAV